MRISDWSSDVCSSDLYFAGEAGLREAIDRLWQVVDWSWHTRDGQEVLYWHWSPRHDWAIDHPIRALNEWLITYVLAAASPTQTRKSFVSGKCASVSVVLGARRSHRKKTIDTLNI